LSRSRINQIVQAGPDDLTPQSEAVEAAMARRDEYRMIFAELRDLARRLPDSQPAPKVGAYRALLDGLDRLTAIEQALGYLPDDLGRLRNERALVEAVFAVFVEYKVPAEARKALVDQLDAAGAA
jgi:hypothetical protein